MKLQALGETGVSLSVIGLGGYELGPEPDEQPDIDRAVRVITASHGVGVNWVDTSENYLATNNESLLGDARRTVGSDFLVASKVAPDAAITGGASGFRPEQVHAACRASLARLARDHLDVYFLHWPDESGVPLEDTWGAMAELAEQGLVRAIGLSNYDLAEIDDCHRQRRVDIVQTGLSMVDHLGDRPLIAGCGQRGIAVVIYEPVASGVLTGKTLAELRDMWSGPWVASGFYKRLLAGSNGERSMAVADGLRPIAARLDATVAQVALAWVLRQPGVTGAIVGSRSGAHMQENAEAANLDLTDVLVALEALIPLGPAFG